VVGRRRGASKSGGETETETGRQRWRLRQSVVGRRRGGPTYRIPAEKERESARESARERAREITRETEAEFGQAAGTYLAQ